MKKILLLIIILLFVKISYASITFNEIMYDSIESEYYNEWIELYNNGNDNITLEGWSLCDKTLLSGYIDHDNGQVYLNKGFVLPPKSYAIITDGGSGTEVYKNSNITEGYAFHVDSSEICGGLNNEQEFIFIKNENNGVVDGLFYFSSWGGSNNNGKSLCKIPNYKGIWQECTSTPGRENSQSINIDFSSIKINEFLPDPVGYDDAFMPKGEFIELYNPGDEDLDLEGFEFKDTANHKLIISDSTTLTGTIIPANGYLIIYMNGFSGFLNNDGLEIVSLYYENMLIDKVSYSFSEEGISWSKIDGIWKKTFPTPNALNLENSSLIEPAIKIERVYLGNDKEASFGDTVNVRVIIYKGNSTKENIELWVEDEYNDYVSKKTKFLADIKFYNYTLTLPLQILPNCNNKFQDGEYTLRLEGLDLSDEKGIDIYGLNEEVCKQAVSETSKKELEFEIISLEEKNNELITNIRIINNKESENFKIWSYIYRGSKSYSGEREENLQEIRVEEKSFKEIELKNSIEDIPPGDYKLKIKLLKEGVKTPKELTKEITIEQAVFSNQEEENFESNINQTSSSVMYESSTMKSRKYAIYFFNAILVILLIELIRKK